VALRLPQNTTPRSTAVLAVLHKQLVHENILAFLGVVEHTDLGIVTAWHKEGDAFSYLDDDSQRHSHVPTLVSSLRNFVVNHIISFLMLNVILVRGCRICTMQASFTGTSMA
jgi:hypothetical protein